MLVNWAIELKEFDIEFHPRTTIKGQVLANFIVEFCSIPESEETWIAYTDGSSTQTSSGSSVFLISPNKDEVSVAIKLAFLTTNNEAEYEAALVGLGIAKELGARNLEIHSDSQVVVGHIQGRFEAEKDKMIKYLAKVQSFRDQFDRMVTMQVPRFDNTRADSLAQLGSRNQNLKAKGESLDSTIYSYS